jgi:hypothetical protein
MISTQSVFRVYSSNIQSVLSEYSRIFRVYLCYNIAIFKKYSELILLMKHRPSVRLSTVPN